jgi:FHA domain
MPPFGFYCLYKIIKTMPQYYKCPLHQHDSTEADFCSECGAKIMGSGIAETPSSIFATSNSISAPCPDCGTPHEPDSGNFCEICGYSFLTGIGGGDPFPAPAIARVSTPDATPPKKLLDPPTITPNSPAPATLKWQVIISIDPSLATPSSPAAPTQAPISIDLTHPTNLIGRSSQARAIHPQIPLDFDDAVSSRHAILTLHPDGSIELRDIGSANGTMVNGKDIAIMVDIPMKSGDEITLGHWTRIKLIGI